MNFRTLFIVVCLLWSSSALSDLQKGAVIRDAEIEKILKNYLDPLFKAAGLNPKEAHIVMMIDSALNAAALPDNTILFYTGFLIEAETPEEIAGVLAHEVGHIAGRHLVRMHGAMAQSQRIGIFGALMGVAVAMLGSPDAGMALALGSSSQALHTFLHYRRTEEEAADMLAVRYLEALKWPILGLRTFLAKLLGQELLSESMQDPYLRTHPITRDRVERVRAKEETYKVTKLPEEFHEQHGRMVVKLKAFIWAPQKTLKTFAGDRIIDLYAQSIAYYRQASFDKAIAVIDALLKREPKNPFFWELKGQILFDSGKVADSVAPYRKAVALFPGSALLQVSLAQSLLKSEKISMIEEALEHLQKALQFEKDNGMAWYYMAIAYGKQKKMSKMAVALAERAFLMGKWDQAVEQSNRAQHFSKKSERDYRRADEIKKLAKEKLAASKKKSIFGV